MSACVCARRSVVCVNVTKVNEMGQGEGGEGGSREEYEGWRE